MRLIDSLGERRAGLCFTQRISLAFKCGNAASILYTRARCQSKNYYKIAICFILSLKKSVGISIEMSYLMLKNKKAKINFRRAFPTHPASHPYPGYCEEAPGTMGKRTTALTGSSEVRGGPFINLAFRSYCA